MLKLKRKKTVKDVKPLVVPPKENEEVSEKLTLRFNSIDSLLNEAWDIDSKCSDYTISRVSSDNFMLNSDKTISYLPNDSEERRVGITPYAFTQLGTKMGVPANYISKCFKRERPDIAIYNLNEWVKEYNGGLFIREYDENIRGVLSPKYSVCDLPDILSSVDDIFDGDEFTVKGSYISPERFHCRLVENERMNIVGEDLYGGISIDSSDVGRSTLSCKFIVWKKVCSNGLIIPLQNFTLFKQKHIGVSSEIFKDSFSKSIEIFPQLCERVGDMIEKTCNSNGLFDFSVNDEEQMTKLIEDIRRTANISPNNAQKVVTIMKDGKYDNNRWGYINALTEVAQDLTLEKRLSLEEYAGRLLVA